MTARSPHLENGFLRAALAAEEEAEEGPAQLFDVRIALLLMHACISCGARDRLRRLSLLRRARHTAHHPLFSTAL